MSQPNPHTCEQAESLYLYAVVPGDSPEVSPPLSLIRHGSLAAVASEPPGALAELAVQLEQAEGDRVGLASLEDAVRTHEAAIERVTAVSVVPLRFGTTVRTTDDVHRLLELHGEAFSSSLSRVAGQVEWSVRVWTDSAPKAAETGSDDTSAASGRAYLERRRLAKESTQRDRAWRERVGARIAERLAAVASEVSLSYDGTGGPPQPDGVQVLARLVCLVPRSSEEVWLDTLDAAMTDVGADVYADVTGPWPPYHFVSLPRLVGRAAEPS